MLRAIGSGCLLRDCIFQMRKYINKILTTWMPKYYLHNDNTNLHANMDERNFNIKEELLVISDYRDGSKSVFFKNEIPDRV